MTSDWGGWTLILTKANSTNHSQFVSGRGTDLDDATTNTDNLNFKKWFCFSKSVCFESRNWWL